MANYTQSQLTALRAAAASGALEVQFEGRMVRYRSIDEILQMISVVENDLSSSGSSTPIRHIRVQASKGT